MASVGNDAVVHSVVLFANMLCVIFVGYRVKDSINSNNIVSFNGYFISLWGSMGWIRVHHTRQFRHSKYIYI